MMVKMTSKLHSMCNQCSKDILPGQRIKWFVQLHRAVHEHCPDLVDSTNTPPVVTAHDVVIRNEDLVLQKFKIDWHETRARVSREHEAFVSRWTATGMPRDRVVNLWNELAKAGT